MNAGASGSGSGGTGLPAAGRPRAASAGGWSDRIRGPWLAVAFFIAVCAYGTAGYMFLEGWPAWDAFYMTAITITTVGYREIHAMSRAGEVFTTTVLLAGVGTFFYTFTLLATVVVDGGIHARLARRRRQHMLDDLKDHFIVCGYGRIGAIIVEELRRQHVPYVVIERDRDRVQAVMEQGGLAVEADASSEEVLTRLGIARARGFIAAVGTDAENVYAVLTARVLRPDLYIIGRAETEDAERKLLRAGANRVVSPYRIGARELAQTALRPAVVDFFQLATRSGNLELAIEQVAIGAASPLAGRSIIDVNVRQRYGLIVVGIQRKVGKMEFNPPGDAVMYAGDQLVVLGRVDGLRELEAAAQASA